MADLSVKKGRKSFIQFESPAGQYPFGGANLQFQDLSLKPTPKIDKTPIKPMGYTYPSGGQRGLESADISIENGNFGFASINYLLEMLCGAGTKTTAGSAMFKRVYVPGTTPRSVALDYGDPAVQLLRFLYCFLTGLSVKGDLNTIGVSGVGVGKPVNYGVTGAASITKIPLRQPNPPTDGLYLASTYSGLGNPGASTPAAVDRFMSFEWAVGAMLDVIATKKPGITTWRKPLETDNATGDVKLTLGNDSTAWAYLSTLRNDDNFFLRYEITGDQLESGTAEVQTIDLSGDDDPTGGVWQATILGITVTGIPWNVSAVELQANFNSLEANGASEITVSKAGFVYTVTFPARLGNVAAITTDNGAGLTGGVGDTFAITISTSTPGVAALHELCAIDCAVTFASHFNPTEMAPLSTLDFDLWLVENADLTGWKVTTITNIDSLSAAA